MLQEMSILPTCTSVHACGSRLVCPIQIFHSMKNFLQVSGTNPFWRRGRATSANFPGKMGGCPSGSLNHKIAIRNQGFRNAGQPEKNTFAAFIAGRELLSLPHHHVMGQAVLVMEHAINTCLRDFFIRAVDILSGHRVAPFATRFSCSITRPSQRVFGYRPGALLTVLDVLLSTRRWLHKWRFSSDFRIIKISQNMF